MNDIYSFYQLISKYQIEIPIIQRDYAQGRNNSKAADVRKSLVDNMIKAVKEDKPLFFDFVYGREDNNKFIPFDGQQRLTSLFLFHKYIFEKCQSVSTCNHKNNCICNDILRRFSYATRQSSREFCEVFVNYNIIPTEEYEKKLDEQNKHRCIQCYIENQSWFYPDWKKDPTVVGMMIMLDEIHCQMKNENDFKTFAEKLTSGCNCPITFHFVDMGEHKMSDETYVKMNARGKSLTPFENFKASLEQYLEGKSKSEDLSVEIQIKYKDLLRRLNGEYDETLQKYTGIDGTWLDLFWKVANINKNEEDLPDTLMMSFFNRHFMNVWRSWYANSSKSEMTEIDDAFNTRIQKEMPLYPTKDNFVLFEIYSYVLDNCRVDECLTPIFNIWDTLCVDNNTVETNYRPNLNQWNLYFGDKNKDNRETYPSRVAFYALMKYFKNSTDTASLTQWMRVVWNIIENSTIDSSDTYHAALRLIEKLSAKSHTIYNALVNEFESFELGNQYHAQEQVKEEIAKAKQILYGTSRSDGKSWEEIIIEAEKYAFFKGAIRFLFVIGKNEDGKYIYDWSKFDTKLGNAKKYFDEKGVKDGENKYRTEAILLKAVLYHVEDFWKYIEPRKHVFDNEAKTWKSNILLEDGWENAVHEILLGNLEISDREGDCLIYRALYSTYLLDYVSKYLLNSRINWIHGHRAIYPPNCYDGIMLDDDNPKFIRNKLLSSDSSINSKQKIDGLNYYKGWNINFEYSENYFTWYTNDTICLMNKEWKSKKLRDEKLGDIPENTYYFKAECFESSVLLDNLNCLINQAQAQDDEQNKPCYDDCQDKNCE